jgi:hypothetical protein
MLIRKEVNGDKLNDGTSSVIVSAGTKDYGYLCRQCHMDDKDYNSTSGTANHWEAVHHCAGDYPYDQRSCGNCHGSGSGGRSRVVCSGGGGGGGSRTITIPAACVEGSSINCDCCHYHGSVVTTDSNDPSPHTRRTF